MGLSTIPFWVCVWVFFFTVNKTYSMFNVWQT